MCISIGDTLSAMEAKCPSPIDLVFCVLIVSHLMTLGSVRLMMTCGDSPHCDTNMCQDVRPLEASHMCHSHQPPVSCQKHLKLGKQ